MIVMPGVEHWLATFGKTAQAKMTLGRIGLALPYVAAAAIGVVALFAANGSANIRAAGWSVAGGSAAAILIAATREAIRLAGIAGSVPQGQTALAYADPATAVGAAGVISVASNLVPSEMKMLTDAALRDDWGQARYVHRRLFPLLRALFLETNPIPLKCAMRLLGQDSGELRLPLAHATSRTEDALRGELSGLGLLGGEMDEYIDPRD